MALSPAERTKLAAVLTRLGSPHDGERAAAGLLADRMVRKAGLTWADLVGSRAAPQSEDRAHQAPPQASEGDLAFCNRHLSRVSPWERNFLGGLLGRSRVSPKQWGVVAGIAASLRRRGAV